jgi:GMP synthase (glutamine-hydrolysing)
LVIEHEAICPSGWMGEWLADDGMETDVRRPYVGDALPDDVTDHGGLLVLGGSMGAHDDVDFPWLAETKQLIRQAVVRGTPTLGICLGLQLATVALGGDVHRNPRGQQIGVLDVGWTVAAQDDLLFGPLTGARRAIQWNDDIVTEPADASVVLARAPTGEVQAVRFAPRAWGVQWHPEAGGEIIRVWADDDRDAAAGRGVDIDACCAEVAAADEEMRRSWRGLATGFAAVVADPGVVRQSPGEPGRL